MSTENEIVAKNRDYRGSNKINRTLKSPCMGQLSIMRVGYIYIYINIYREKNGPKKMVQSQSWKNQSMRVLQLHQPRCKIKALFFKWKRKKTTVLIICKKIFYILTRYRHQKSSLETQSRPFSKLCHLLERLTPQVLWLFFSFSFLFVIPLMLIFRTLLSYSFGLKLIFRLIQHLYSLKEFNT